MTERPLIHAAILAHQGGWDEILLVAGPILVIVGVLWVVRRRVDANLADPDHEAGHDDHEQAPEAGRADHASAAEPGRGGPDRAGQDGPVNRR